MATGATVSSTVMVAVSVATSPLLSVTVSTTDTGVPTLAQLKLEESITSEAMPQFKDVGAEVLGVSTDSHFTHLAWLNTPRTEGGLGHIEYPLLADISKDISRNYNVLVENPEDPMYGAALRGIFIIDGDGKLRSMQVNDDAVGRSVDETLRLITAF